jgi:hypothetical protein
MPPMLISTCNKRITAAQGLKQTRVCVMDVLDLAHERTEN